MNKFRQDSASDSRSEHQLDSADGYRDSRSSVEQPIEPLHSIGVVSRQTGLKPDLLRAWERRYGAVAPTRTAGRQRTYTSADIYRLRLLRRATQAGHHISHIARLPIAELEKLVPVEATIERTVASGHRAPASGDTQTVKQHLEGCLDAVRNLDGRSLERQLEQASIDLTGPQIVENLLVPLMNEIGDSWQNGNLRVVHEHFASEILRTFALNLRRSNRASSAPRLVITTPAGQHHGIGALLATATAELEGWEVTFLGTNLPAEEIAAAVRLRRAQAVGLSITFPARRAELESDLRRLRRLLGAGIPILVGGRSVKVFETVLSELRARIFTDLTTFRRDLQELLVLAQDHWERSNGNGHGNGQGQGPGSGQISTHSSGFEYENRGALDYSTEV